MSDVPKKGVALSEVDGTVLGWLRRSGGRMSYAYRAAFVAFVRLYLFACMLGGCCARACMLFVLFLFVVSFSVGLVSFLLSSWSLCLLFLFLPSSSSFSLLLPFCSASASYVD